MIKRYWQDITRQYLVPPGPSPGAEVFQPQTWLTTCLASGTPFGSTVDNSVGDFATGVPFVHKVAPTTGGPNATRRYYLGGAVTYDLEEPYTLTGCSVASVQELVNSFGSVLGLASSQSYLTAVISVFTSNNGTTWTQVRLGAFSNVLGINSSGPYYAVFGNGQPPSTPWPSGRYPYYSGLLSITGLPSVRYVGISITTQAVNLSNGGSTVPEQWWTQFVTDFRVFGYRTSGGGEIAEIPPPIWSESCDFENPTTVITAESNNPVTVKVGF